MATKDESERKPRKKLTLNKETIRDLTVKNDRAQTLRAGYRGSVAIDCPSRTCSNDRLCPTLTV